MKDEVGEIRCFSDGDVPSPEVQALLDELDPLDTLQFQNTRDVELERRINAMIEDTRSKTELELESRIFFGTEADSEETEDE